MSVADWKSLPAGVFEVFKKYRILGDDGSTQVDLIRSRDAKGRLLGKGPILDEDSIGRFVSASMVDGEVKWMWLDWIVYQAGGGKEAQERSEKAFSKIADRFRDERLRGFRDMAGKRHLAEEPAAVAKAWDESGTFFQQQLSVADQDIVEKLRVFGFYRHWPGPDKHYAKVTKAVERFLSLSPKALEVNASVLKAEQRSKLISFDPCAYESAAALDAASDAIDLFFKSREIREDVRVDAVYEDEIVRVLCPLTYAASVKYGCEAWPFSSRARMEECLEHGFDTWNNPWLKVIKKELKCLFFFEFKVPMPNEATFDPNTGEFKRSSIGTLAMVCPRLSSRVEELFDDAGNQLDSLSVLRGIEAEALRIDTGNTSEYPILRGPKVFETMGEASLVMHSFNKGQEAALKWARNADFGRLVIDYPAKA